MTQKNPLHKPGKGSVTFIAFAVSALVAGFATFLFYNYNHGKQSPLISISNAPDKEQQNVPSSGSLNLADFDSSQQINGSRTDIMEIRQPVKIPNEVETIVENTSIHPPMPYINVELEKMIVDATKGQTFVSKHNSSICIPPNAFLNKQGQIVQGQVEINLREFHNYVDIFLSGIPMNYKSGESAQLESAGMLEITASKDNQELYVNPESKINIMMASLNSSPDFSLYFFDKTQNQWVEKGKDKIIEANTDANRSKSPNSIMDSTETLFRFNGKNYKVRLICIDSPFPKKQFLTGKKKNPNRFTFKLLSVNQSVPELKSLNAISWAYIGTDAIEVYNNLFYKQGTNSVARKTNRKWENLSIDASDENQKYILSLHSEGDSTEIIITPKFSSSFARIKFNSNLAVFYDKQNQRKKTDQDAWDKFKSDTALYYVSNNRYSVTTEQSRSFVLRQFAIDGFGIWNADKLFKQTQVQSVLAKFVDEQGDTLTPENVYLVEPNRNTVYTYTKQSFSKFVYNPKVKNLMWAVLSDGRLAVIPPKIFEEKYSNPGKVCVFTLEVSPNKPLSSQDVREKLIFDL